MTTNAPSPQLTEIQELEAQIAADKRRLAELRRSTPSEQVADHELRDLDGALRLSELFGDREELIVIHNMGGGCSYCTLWADGFNGLHAHLEDRAAFVVSSPDAPEAQRAIAETRGWTFRMVSADGSDFTQAMGFAAADGSSMTPGVSTFTRREDGTIERVAHAVFGPGDNYCPAWDLFDLLPDREWSPRKSYAAR